MCADIQKHILNETEARLLQVKLNHSLSQSPQLARTGYIQIDHRRLFILDNLLSSLPKGVFRLELSVKENPVLKIGDLDKVLQISVGDQCSNRIDHLKIGAHRTDYSILFYPDEIVDCHVVQTGRPEDDEFQLEYELRIFNVKDKDPWDTLSSSITISIERFGSVEPAVSFIPKNNEIEYRRADNLEVGVLRISNGGGFYRAPALDVSFGLSASIRGITVPGLVTLGEKARSFYGRPVLNPLLKTNSSSSNVAAGGDCDKFEDDLGGRKKILGLCVNTVKNPDGALKSHCYEVPVLLHLNASTLSNPYADEEIVFSVSYRSRSYYNRSEPLGHLPEKVVEAGRITLLKNKKLMALDVVVGDEGADYHVKNKESHLFNAEFFGWNNDDSESRISYHLEVRNRAEEPDPLSPGAGICITDFQIGAPVLQHGCRIQFKGDDSDESVLFDKGEDSVPTEFDLPNGGDPFRLNIDYTDAHIDKMYHGTEEVYSMEVEIPVSFNYFLDREGARHDGVSVQGEADSFSTQLRFRIFKRAMPQWLCVDFGTSAIVASFSDSIDDPDRLVPLKKKKSVLYQDTWTDSGAWEDRTETDDHLVSSAIVLQDVNLRASVDGDPMAYGHCSVMLSPPSVGYTEYYLRLLPCLKSIVGNRNLPYELIPSAVRMQLSDRKAQISVRDIVWLVYRQFFNCFLKSDPDHPDELDIRGTHRLVLSYPNTFTPVQIDLIRRTAQETLPNLRSDYLRFISESDAVAFYYNSHREEFIRNSGALLEGRRDTFDKNVLVFDMGAGTLDLTYFTRERVPNARGHHNTRITIKGKLGLSKAGDYLDYVLASILVNRLCEHSELQDNQMQAFLRDLVSLEENRASLSAASALKRYVKDSVKPLLNKPEDTCLDDSLAINGMRFSQLKDIKVGDIVSDGLYSDFLNSVSRFVFENFVYLFGTGRGDGKSIPLDMVVFSGRMTGLLHIRKAVRDSLDILTGGAVHCLFADLSSMRLITDVTAPVQDVTGLKTAVVDGALAFCLGRHSFELVNRNIYATYGVILKLTGGGASWLPLIDYRTEGVRPASLSRDGMLVQEYDSRIKSSSERSDVLADNVDIQNVSEIVFVQSFSKDTLADWSAGRMELISVLGSERMDLGHYSNGPVRIYLLIDSNNQMKLYIGSTFRVLSPREDYRNESFAKSMWPVRRGR